MNPYGQVHDINSLRKQGFNVESALSPEIAQEIVRGLNSPKGKGIQFFSFKMFLYFYYIMREYSKM